MVLIVGGAYQGKSAYTEEHFGEGYTIIDDYHLRVKEALRQGKNPMEEAENFWELNREKEERLVIVTAEQGCGVVPMDPLDREFREQAGRVNCYLAKLADSVIYVTCGIGRKIK